MALTFTTNQSGATADYAKYLSGSPSKNDQVNQPTFLDFSLIPYNSAFVKLTRGTRIVLSTSTYPNWFTGYITNDPTLSFLGSKIVAGVKTPIYGYTYEATDDSYLLNLNPVGILPPFVNSSTGAIIKALINQLDIYDLFDVTNVAAGAAISRYIVDPNKKFTEILADFTDPMGYRWSCRDYALRYEKQDAVAATITIDGNSKHFQAQNLVVTPSTDPFINDVVVVGTVEAQNHINEYWIGDGITNAFPMMSSAFGVNSALLIDDTFSDGGINSQNWTVFDPTSTKLLVSNGYLNCLGGSANSSYDVSLQSLSVLALEANLRMTHGQWDFIDSASAGVNGIICGLWTQAPNSSLTGCIFGIRVNKSGSVTTLNPICNGVLDTSQSMVVDFTKRYVIRTAAPFTKTRRQTTSFNYRTRLGVVTTYTPVYDPTNAIFQTYLTSVDPVTGALGTSIVWNNTIGNLSAATIFATYILLASNDLHATVTGTTISYGILGTLEIANSVSGTLIPYILGDNEIDSLDGLAPRATITQSSGASSRNNNLGTVQANPGSAVLAFFADSLNLTTTTPPAKSLIHLSYRHAGNAVARVQDGASVLAEATAWGDNGIRSVTRTDLNPLPQTSQEAEMAAAALIGEYSYQKFQGTYTQYSGYEFTGEPVSGTILKFQNLTASFPSALSSALIDQVVTTMDVDGAHELFTHNLSFGKLTKVQAVLAGIAGKADVIGTLNPDPVDSLPFVDVASVGLAFCADVESPTFVSVDASNYNFTTNQAPPSGGGFEVRSTDSDWGSDDAKNLIVRQTAQAFAVPRTIRGRVCFVKGYDVRNKLLWSEDLTQTAWTKTSATAALVTTKTPNGNTASISKITFSSTAGKVVQLSGIAAASAQACYTVSILGTVGHTVVVQLANTSSGTVAQQKTITLTGKWQRVTCTGTFGSGVTGNVQVLVGSPSSATDVVFVTQAGLEIGTAAETTYCKTNAAIYGANSRFASGLRCNFPLVPPAPTATLDSTDEANPIITVVLPALLQDVWGVEIRASNNTTKLLTIDLSAASFVPTFTVAGNATRTPSFFIYTYNLLGEYSASYNLTGSFATPAVTSLAVNESTGKLTWTGTNSLAYKVEIATDSGFSNIILTKSVTDSYIALDDQSILQARWFRVTPSDVLGNGTAVTLSHTHTPAGAGAWLLSDNVFSLPAILLTPITGTAPIVPVPVKFGPYVDEITERVQRIKTLNTGAPRGR